jgi:hypothetical protein
MTLPTPARPASTPWAVTVPFAWIGLVLIATIAGAAAGYFRRVQGSEYAAFLVWQSALVAGVFLAVHCWHLGRRWLTALSVAVSVLVIAHEALALPLNLYACAQWVKAAREAGLFTLW